MLFQKMQGADYLIVGLGNPGEKYINTRHNAGFIAADLLAEDEHIKINKLKFRSLYGSGVIDGVKVVFLKPQTYMNLSGEAVAEAMRFYKLPPERVIILFDDISLPPGKLRVRPKGSHGGHNGLKNIFSLCGSEDFPRVKIGIGDKPHPDYDLADYVTSAFKRDEIVIMKKAFSDAGGAVKLILAGQLDRAMNVYN